VEVQFAGGQDVTVAGHQLQQQAGLCFIAVCLWGGITGKCSDTKTLGKTQQSGLLAFYPHLSKQPTAFIFTH